MEEENTKVEEVSEPREEMEQEPEEKEEKEVSKVVDNHVGHHKHGHATHNHKHGHHHDHHDHHDHSHIDADILNSTSRMRAAIGGFILWLSLVSHSVFDGLAIGILSDIVRRFLFCLKFLF